MLFFQRRHATKPVQCMFTVGSRLLIYCEYIKKKQRYVGHKKCRTIKVDLKWLNISNVLFSDPGECICLLITVYNFLFVLYFFLLYRDLLLGTFLFYFLTGNDPPAEYGRNKSTSHIFGRIYKNSEWVGRVAVVQLKCKQFLLDRSFRILLWNYDTNEEILLKREIRNEKVRGIVRYVIFEMNVIGFCLFRNWN